MKKTNLFKKLLSAVVCIVLIAAMGLVLTSCDDKDTDTAGSTASQTQSTASDTPSAPADGYGSAAEDIGSGATSFIFRVTDKDGYDTLYRVHTDEKTVGAALQKYGMISGEDSDYGLFVKTVTGITADYDVDKTYWAFYIDNEYAVTGVDRTEIKANAEYCFKVEK